MNQPFNEKAFCFSWVRPEEIIFNLRNVTPRDGRASKMGNGTVSSQAVHNHIDSAYSDKLLNGSLDGCLSMDSQIEKLYKVVLCTVFFFLDLLNTFFFLCSGYQGKKKLWINPQKSIWFCYIVESMCFKTTLNKYCLSFLEQHCSTVVIPILLAKLGLLLGLAKLGLLLEIPTKS